MRLKRTDFTVDVSSVVESVVDVSSVDVWVQFLFKNRHPKKRSKTFSWLHIDVNDSGDFLEDALNETPGEGKEKVGVRKGP